MNNVLYIVSVQPVISNTYALCDMPSPTSPKAEGSSVEKVMRTMKANVKAPWAAGQESSVSQILQNQTNIILIIYFGLSTNSIVTAYLW